ncbi:MAG: UPF0176 protein [Candidatus Omnitrophota bacterium]|jgi:UPF0176 protein
MYEVILYYKFAEIDDTNKFMLTHKRKCVELGLLGRIYLSVQGVNGTVSGTPKQIKAYKSYVTSLEGFEDTEFKQDQCDEVPFKKLIVRVREEIVALKGSIKVDPGKKPGKYLAPHQWKEVLDSEEEITLLDVRNEYESDIGHFEGAICPEAENFFDFEKWLDEQKLSKDKKVLMYCTGGIRCEVFSVFMENKGYKDVNQLHGGIIKYSQEVGDDHYKGKCFVFDDRLTVPIEKNQKEPLTRCVITDVPCDKYLNCYNPECNKLFICSEEGAKKHEGCCCAKCMKYERRRPFDPTNIYGPTRKWYNYHEDKKSNKSTDGDNKTTCS